MSRAVLIPLAWAEKLSAEALRTLVFVASYANRADGMCWPSNAELVRVIGKDERTIQRDLKTAEELGFIERIDGSGKNRRFRILTPEWFSQPRRGMSGLNDDNHDTGRRGKGGQPRHGASPNPDTGRRGIPDMGRRGPNKNIRIEHNQEHYSSSKRESFSEESEPVEKSAAAAGTNLEPFESGTPGRLPAVRNGVAPFRPRIAEIVPTKLRPETVDRIADVLGQDGDQFARKITQEQADAGFPDWVLSKAEGGKSPIGFAMHLLKTAWRDGWANPQTAEDARLEEMAEAMRNLK